MGLLDHETNYFGLDIGSTAIRLVQLRASGAKSNLVTYGSVPVPAGLTTSDSQLDQDKVAGVIRQLVKDARVSTKNVVAGLPSTSIFATVITTPKLSHAELAKAIKFQADQYVPMALDQVKLDWSVVGAGAGDNELEVLLVAAPNTVAAKYANILEKAGLEVVVLESNAMAVARAVVPPSELAMIVLDIGNTTSDLTLMYQNTPRLMRSIPVGGSVFVQSVAQNLGLDRTQAEQFTYRFGLTQTKLEGQVLRAIKPSIDQLVGEIQKSSKFFLSRYEGTKLEKIVLTGSTSALPELPVYLATATGLPVEIGNAWINVAYPAGMQDKLMLASSQYAAASGLAQRMFAQ
ncbi:MAG TPA: type IV pilus assembly protein PilM [Candidatus Saccharimonadales bacterium]|nr:type IV pilus assembly protein PilM [Candidatus Saccharimonadales bacterium]